VRSSNDVRIHLWLSRSSFLTPLAWLVGALVLGFAAPAIDDLLNIDTGIPQDAARDMLTAIGTGMIAFTGLVFSLGLLIVQFSSQSLSPRAIPELRRDRFIGHSLGVFVATFVFCLGAVVDVGDTSDSAPTATVAIAFALLILSVLAFLGLIQRITSGLQIPVVLARLGTLGRQAVDQIYPEPFDGTTATRQPAGLGTGTGATTLLHHGGPAVVATVALAELQALAAQHDATIELVPAIGQRVPTGQPLLRLAPGPGGTEPDHHALRRAIVFAPARTIEQDPAYALRVIVDIAIKALSPAINDPTTATQALDEIEDLLALLAERDLAQSDARLIVRTPTWGDLVDLGLDEIGQFGARSIQVARRMRALIADLLERVPPARRPALQAKLDALDDELDEAFPHPALRATAATADPLGLGLARRPAPEAP